MMVYTSYYAKAKSLCRDFACVRVSASVPSWFPWLAGELPEVYPSWNIVYGVKTGAITEEDFEQEYLRQLCRNSKARVIRKLTEISAMHQGADILLLCWEKKGVFCHRHILGRWLNLGIEELTDYDLGGMLL